MSLVTHIPDTKGAQREEDRVMLHVGVNHVTQRNKSCHT